MKRSLFRLLPPVVFAVLILLPGSASARRWTDAEGRVIEAELDRVTADTVFLRLPDGRVFGAKMDSLSEADQTYARENGDKTKSALMYAAVARIDGIVAKGWKAQGVKPNEPLNDSMFVRRVYLDLAGTIPSYGETKAFLDSRDSDKRAKLVASLLQSEGYVSHLYNYFGEILRVQSTVPGTILRLDPYIAWLKESIRANKPFDKLVREMVTANGRLWDDPAVGYHLRDNGMKLDHVSYMTKVFLGTDISCAQCHDDPYKDWTQYDYYQLSAYLGEMDTKGAVAGGSDRKKKDRGYGLNGQELDKYLVEKNKIDLSTEKGKQQLRSMRNRYNRTYRDMVQANQLVVGDKAGVKLRLPADYQYDDANPNAPVEPRPLFGEAPESKAKDAEAPREVLADWLTSPKNPRFAITIANRLWALYFGRGVAEPLHDIDPEKCSNPELLKALGEEMVRLDFDLRAFVWVIVNTDAYNRLAAREKAPEDKPYYFQGPVLRRMTAEQIWDSLVTLMVDDPLRYRSGPGEEFQKLINLGAAKQGAIEEALKRIDSVRGYREMSNLTDSDGKPMPVMAKAKAKAKPKKPVKAGKKGQPAEEESMMSEDEMMAMVMGDAARHQMALARASELQQPAPPGHFLDKFGQSERNFVVDASTVKGSVPQVMELMNGYATEILTNPNSLIFQRMKNEKDIGKKAEIIFLSILSRPTLIDERRLLTDELREGGDGAMADLIWALLNTPEFFFVK